jgi:hypothetical protein
MSDPQETLPEIVEEMNLLMACVYVALGSRSIPEDVVFRQMLSGSLVSSMRTLKKHGLDHLQWAKKARGTVPKGSKAEKDITATINMLAERIG